MTLSSSTHHSDVSHHSFINPINAHHLPMNQITIIRQSINRINCNHSPINQCQERQSPRLIKSVRFVKTSETSETAETAEAAEAAQRCLCFPLDPDYHI
jgi:hypothetical protein